MRCLSLRRWSSQSGTARTRIAEAPSALARRYELVGCASKLIGSRSPGHLRRPSRGRRRLSFFYLCDSPHRTHGAGKPSPRAFQRRADPRSAIVSQLTVVFSQFTRHELKGADQKVYRGGVVVLSQPTPECSKLLYYQKTSQNRVQQQRSPWSRAVGGQQQLCSSRHSIVEARCSVLQSARA